MVVNQLDQAIVAFALELYLHQFGREKYDELIALRQFNPTVVADILHSFIDKNEDYIVKEMQMDVVANVLESENS